MENVREWLEKSDRLRGLDRAVPAPGDLGALTEGMGVGEGPWRERLSRVIEGEIIPRLMLSHHPAPGADAPGRVELDQHDIAHFARLVIGPDVAASSDYVTGLRKRGLSIESLFLDVLAPTARRLGELWTQDRCDFVDVTIGVSRLQNLLREFNPAFRMGTEDLGGLHRILLMPAPGERHSFGIAMVEKFFRSFGWDVAGSPGQSVEELSEVLRAETFGIVGFSLSCITGLDALAAAIRTVRKISRNPTVGIMVGGPIFLEQPELVVLIGADATAPDGFTAVLLAQSLVEMRVSTC